MDNQLFKSSIELILILLEKKQLQLMFNLSRSQINVSTQFRSNFLLKSLLKLKTLMSSVVFDRITIRLMSNKILEWIQRWDLNRDRDKSWWWKEWRNVSSWRSKLPWTSWCLGTTQSSFDHNLNQDNDLRGKSYSCLNINLMLVQKKISYQKYLLMELRERF